MAGGRSASIAKAVTAAMAALCLSAPAAFGEVTGVMVTSQTPWSGGRPFGAAGAYEKIEGRVVFAIDPAAPANARIADLRLAPRDRSGRVIFSSDFVLLRPADPAKARGAVLMDTLNRGHTNARGVFFSTPGAAPFRIESLDHVTFDDAFLFEQGFTVAWLGWQYDLPRGAVRIAVPVAPVHSLVREAFLPDAEEVSSGVHAIPASRCAERAAQPGATLSWKTRFEGPLHPVPRAAWAFVRQAGGGRVADPCSIRLAGGFKPDHLYEAVYTGAAPALAGLGLAAVRDFVSYLKYGGVASPLRDHPQTEERVLGYGYSQGARFLRQYLYQGFTADEHGRPTFDGLFVASAGAGRGSFNHRYAMPGEAGVSVLSDLRPVDLFPFTDEDETDPVTGRKDGLLDAAKRSSTLPRIIYTYSSSEYWQRGGSLAYTSPDAARDLPIDAAARLYFFAGTPHAHGPFPPDHGAPGEAPYRHLVNFASSKWGFRALLLDLDDWVASGRLPPPSAYPRLPGELVARSAVAFPAVPGLAFPTDIPPAWRLDFGPAFATTGVIDREPPALGAPFALRVPQVDADGNDLGGIDLPFLAAPLGTYTGWNYEDPRLLGFHHLAGLIGAFSPFPRTRVERSRTGDPRLSIEERYADRDAYLERTRAVASGLIERRLVRREDLHAIVEESGRAWDGLVGSSGEVPTLRPPS